MAHRLITPPASKPVTLAEAKAHLRVDTADDDTYINSLIDVATQIVDGREERVAITLMSQTWELSLDAFPTTEIQLPRHPVISITSVMYDAEDGFEQEYDSANYTFDPDGWLFLNTGQSWPTPIDAFNSVRIRYVAGHADAAEIPAPIRHAILLLIGHYYQSREEVTYATIRPWELPVGVQYLLAPYRDWFV